jgi:hypothetical protein
MATMARFSVVCGDSLATVRLGACAQPDSSLNVRHYTRLHQPPDTARPAPRYLIECLQRERDTAARGVAAGRERSGYGSRAVGRDHHRRGA